MGKLAAAAPLAVALGEAEARPRVVLLLLLVGLGAYLQAVLPPLLVAARVGEHAVVKLHARLPDRALLDQLGHHHAHEAVAQRHLAQQLRLRDQPLVDLDDAAADARVHLERAAVAHVDVAHHVALRQEDRPLLALAGDARLEQVLAVVRAVAHAHDAQRRLDRRVRRRDAEHAEPVRVDVHALVVLGRVGRVVPLPHGREDGPAVDHGGHRDAADVARARLLGGGVGGGGVGGGGIGGGFLGKRRRLAAGLWLVHVRKVCVRNSSHYSLHLHS